MTLTPAEQIAFWSDRLRDMAATGLKYSQNIYDHERYAAIQQIALEMLALATERPVAEFEPLRDSIFSHSSPLVAGTAAIINDDGEILLMRRIETLEIGWFAEDALPHDLFTGHVQRVRDAFSLWRGEQRAYFDK
jgi:hypothetical protein